MHGQNPGRKHRAAKDRGDGRDRRSLRIVGEQLAAQGLTDHCHCARPLQDDAGQPSPPRNLLVSVNRVVFVEGCVVAQVLVGIDVELATSGQSRQVGVGSDASDLARALGQFGTPDHAD